MAAEFGGLAAVLMVAAVMGGPVSAEANFKCDAAQRCQDSLQGRDVASLTYLCLLSSTCNHNLATTKTQNMVSIYVLPFVGN
jgi:hypothetical protein